MSQRNTPTSVAYFDDDIKFKYSNKRERDDDKFETNYYKKILTYR